jgi:hypothetical protein
MPNFGTLVFGPPDIRRIFAEYRFAEYRRSRISLLRSPWGDLMATTELAAPLAVVRKHMREECTPH